MPTLNDFNKASKEIDTIVNNLEMLAGYAYNYFRMSRPEREFLVSTVKEVKKNLDLGYMKAKYDEKSVAFNEKKERLLYNEVKNFLANAHQNVMKLVTRLNKVSTAPNNQYNNILYWREMKIDNIFPVRSLTDAEKLRKEIFVIDEYLNNLFNFLHKIKIGYCRELYEIMNDMSTIATELDAAKDANLVWDSVPVTDPLHRMYMLRKEHSRLFPKVLEAVLEDTEERIEKISTYITGEV